MPSPLIPEKPLAFSPELAATIGLEEAILLATLADILWHSELPAPASWTDANPARLARLLPFWLPADIHRISQSLAAQGILRTEGPAYDGRRPLRFTLDAAQSGSPAARYPAAAATPRPVAAPAAPGASPMRPDWQPTPDTVRQLAMHSIPADFIAAQVAEFVIYWRDRKEAAHSWDARFYRQVLRSWREAEVRFPAGPEAEASPMRSHWHPQPDTISILMKSGIPGDFIEECLPEFVLYWSERGDARKTWNSDFIQHVRRQWLHLTESLAHEKEPRVIPDRWQPGDDVFDILAMANIDAAFARDLVPAFVLYWKEAGKPHRSWNSKFLQHVKHQWAKAQQTEKSYAEQFIDTYTDTSWADHL